MKKRRIASRGGRVFSAILPFLIFLGLAVHIVPTEPKREYKIKAGFLYNFLLFAEWPSQSVNSGPGNIIIGIIGKNPYGDVFRLVEGEVIGGKKLVIRRFEKDVPPEQLLECRVLYISPKLESQIETIIGSLEGHPVITVSELKGFAERGGMINFRMIKNKVAFEINIKAVQRAGIILSSKLLRVAVRIIGEKDEQNYRRSTQSGH